MGRVLVHSTVIWLLAGASLAYSQSVSVGLGAGLLDVQGPDFYTRATTVSGVYKVNGTHAYSWGMGFGVEYQIQGVMEYRIDPLNLAVGLDLTYAFMRGHGDSRIPIGDYYDPTKLTTKQDFLSIGLGGNYYFVRGALSPFVRGTVEFVTFGETRFRNDFGNIWQENGYNGGFNRWGGALGAGVDVTLTKSLSARVACLYNWHNIGGREEGEGVFRSIGYSILLIHEVGL